MLFAQASGRPMVLTVEGSPDDSLLSAGGLGNAKRVGHDIGPTFAEMTSLVDSERGCGRRDTSSSTFTPLDTRRSCIWSVDVST